MLRMPLWAFRRLLIGVPAPLLGGTCNVMQCNGMLMYWNVMWCDLCLQDLSVVSREELVMYLREQGGFCLRKSLRDMGVSVDGMKSYGERTRGCAPCCRQQQGGGNARVERAECMCCCTSGRQSAQHRPSSCYLLR